MGGRGSKSRITLAGGGSLRFSGASQNLKPDDDAQPQITPDPQLAATANDSRFKAVDAANFHDLYGGKQYYQDQAFGIDTQVALMSYLDNNNEPGSMYSPSQNLNNAMATGKKLTAQQQFVHDSMMEGMHNLGYNLNLQRYDHGPMVDSLLSQAGVRGDWHHMSESSLRNILVGMSYSENKFISTSYNDFKNASDRTFTTREVKIQYKARAATQALMPGNGPGGRLGEIVLAPNQVHRITDVRIDTSAQGVRRKGSPVGSNDGRRIIITVEV